jgi:subtilisin family serine protease
MDWVTGNHKKPAVANMSLGGGFSQSVNDAAQRMITAGVTTAVAAGNGNMFGIPQDACKSSPASTPDAITVGSTTKTDTESSFSNYGRCVDILAPGSSISSAWHTGDTNTNTISGTSMATPHVTGVAALYLSANSEAMPATVTSALTGKATFGAISLNRNSKRYGTPNKLLFTDY